VTEMMAMTTKPHTNGDKPLPKRDTPTMLPASWMERGVRVEYTDAKGKGVETSAKLLATCPAGLILAVDGARMCLSWDRWTMLELVED
jgi:hypothetical protein